MFDRFLVGSIFYVRSIFVYVRNTNGGRAHLRDSTNVDRPLGPPWGHGGLSSHKDCFMYVRRIGGVLDAKVAGSGCSADGRGDFYAALELF